MANELITTHRKLANQLIFIQFFILCALCISFTLLVNMQSGWSALLGGLAWSIPSFIFTKQFLFKHKIKTPQQIIKDFYLNEVLKLAFSIALFIFILKMFQIFLGPLLAGYIISIISVWIITTWMITKNT